MGNPKERFRPLPGLPGRLYVPADGAPRKHRCADCFACQWCSDTRCTACRGEAHRCAPPGRPHRRDPPG